MYIHMKVYMYTELLGCSSWVPIYSPYYLLATREPSFYPNGLPSAIAACSDAIAGLMPLLSSMMGKAAQMFLPKKWCQPRLRGRASWRARAKLSQVSQCQVSQGQVSQSQVSQGQAQVLSQ